MAGYGKCGLSFVHVFPIRPSRDKGQGKGKGRDKLARQVWWLQEMGVFQSSALKDPCRRSSRRYRDASCDRRRSPRKSCSFSSAQRWH